MALVKIIFLEFKMHILDQLKMDVKPFNKIVLKKILKTSDNIFLSALMCSS